MAQKLTATNTGTAANDKLASIALSSSGDTHLVLLSQKTAWTNKQLLATPSAARWYACMSTGIQEYPSALGSSTVKTDTQPLVDAVATCMASAAWRTGYHPIVNAFLRGRAKGPYSHRSGVASSTARAEYVHSAAAYQFKLRHLHFSKMSSYRAYLRVYVPSLTVQTNLDEPGAMTDSSNDGQYSCTLFNGHAWCNASKLCCRLSTTLPSCTADVAAGFDAWEIAGSANNGTTVSSDTRYSYHSVAYNPYHGDDCVTMPVWTANQRTSTGVPSAKPTLYYHDFQLTNAANLAVLQECPASVWATLHFTRGNGFASGSGYERLMPDASLTAWAYRADLVFSCTSAAFNNA